MSDNAMNWEQAVQWLRNQPDQRDLVLACFYDDPVAAAALRYLQSTEWTAVRKLLPRPAGRALDLGAGRGISSYALAREGWHVTALEPDGGNVVGAGAIRALSGESRLDITVVQEWGEKLPFADAQFDLVYCRQSLHHARDLRQVCREIGRVLRPAGTFIATREHVISRREDLEIFLRHHPLHHLYGGESAYLLADYRSAIEAGGIRLSRVLNPLQSDINLYPETMTGVKRRIGRRIALPFPKAIPDFMLGLLGRVMRHPGRLYSFVGTRRIRG